MGGVCVFVWSTVSRARRSLLRAFLPRTVAESTQRSGTAARGPGGLRSQSRFSDAVFAPASLAVSFRTRIPPHWVYSWTPLHPHTRSTFDSTNNKAQRSTTQSLGPPAWFSQFRRIRDASSSHPVQHSPRTPRTANGMQRTRGRASPSADSWVRRADGVLSGDARGASDDAWSGGSGSGSDSAYGTVDESDPPLVSLRRRSSGGKGKARLRSALSRSASVGWTRAPTLNREGLFALDLDFTHDGSSSEDLSASSSPSTLSVASSRRSSPEPSECDFFTGTPIASPRSSDLHKPSLIFATPPPTFLARRHTVPQRKRVRAASISLAFVSPPTSPVSAQTHPDELIASVATLPSFPPATFAAAVLTATLSLASRIAPVALLPASPVHLLRVRDHRAVESVNAILSPFLVTASSTAVGLGVANLVSLKSLEEQGSTGAEMAGLWGAIVAVRVTLAWVFGRVLGWAHPSLFSTQAIHQVGAGARPRETCSG